MAVFSLACPIDNCITKQVATPTAGISKGAFATVGSVNGFALGGVNQNADGDPEFEQYTMIVSAPVVKALKDASNITDGAELFYDSGAGKVTTDNTGSVRIGWALEAAGTSATEVLIRFNGEILTYT